MEIPAVYLSRTLSHLLSAHEQYIYIYAEMSSISLKLWNMFEDPMLYATLCSWGIETGWEVTLISLNIIILLSHVLSQKKHKHLQWKGEGTDIWKRPWPTSVGWTNITRPLPDCQVLPLSILSRFAVLGWCVTVHRYTGHCAAPQQKGWVEAAVSWMSHLLSSVVCPSMTGW